MNDKYSVIQHSLGFYQIENPPTDSELSDYYEQQYFQKGLGGYELSYSEEELEYNDAIVGDTFSIVASLQSESSDRTLLDVGCGEGWSLAYFRKRGWDVTGLDFGSFGIKKFNPTLEENLIVGNIYENLTKLKYQRKKFSVILLDNVLEHVKDPISLLKQIREVSDKHSILAIKVPNDFSILQDYLIENNIIEKHYWVAFPDHLAYFTKDSLSATAEFSGWDVKDVLADFPIDFFLLNKHSNYYSDQSKGKEAHLVRTHFTNFLHQHSPEKKREFFRSMANIGLGRQIIAFLQPKNNEI